AEVVVAVETTDAAASLARQTEDRATPLAGEDHALLLGFTMMGVAVLMYFLFGLTLVRPYLFSNWKEESNCTLVRAEIQQDRVDCKKHGSYPCLEVFVNLSVFVNLTVLCFHCGSSFSQCFSLPKCQWNKKEALKEAQNIQQYLRNRGGSPFPCHGKAEEQPDQAILFRKYNGGLVVRHMLWATLVLAGGTGIICLLRLNQHLSRLCEEVQISHAPKLRTKRLLKHSQSV
uniref:Potassium calcium-activated channel subfamily M regulatory beta subunit 3 n=1 Tax=Scleropages formosus TaxID=113540 RepID=A0A8C9TSS7_SCLFO